jgi:hypothetical protein
VFTLSGRMEAEQVPELKELFDRDYRNIILDLRDVRLADRDAVRFLTEVRHEMVMKPPKSFKISLGCREVCRVGPAARETS